MLAVTLALAGARSSAHADRTTDTDVRVRFETRTDHGVLVLAAVVDADPGDVVAGVRLELYRRDGVVEIREPGEHGNMVVPDPRMSRIRAIAVDGGGAAVSSVTWTPGGGSPQRWLPRDRDAEPARDPLLGRWYVWGGAALVTGVTATWFGLRASADWTELDSAIQNSAANSYARARELERSGRRNALLANAGAGVAVGLSGVAVVLLVRELWGDDDSQQIVPVAVPGGAALSLRGEF